MNPPKALDLFCGAGGLTLGLRQAGFSVVGGLDADKTALASFKLNHRSVRTWHCDIRKQPATKIRRALRLKRGSLDLLAGCPPCQAFSTLRTLNGRKRIRDLDKELLFEFLRFVRVFYPKTVLLENVPGLAKDRRLRDFASALVKLGYGVDSRIVDAADYGVPQRRRRLILLASRVGPVAFATPAKHRRTVRMALRGLPPPQKSRDPLHRISEQRSEAVLNLIASIPKNGGSRSDLGPEAQLSCHDGFDGFFDVYGRMAWDDQSPTITSGCVNPSKGRFLHPSQNRCISLREAALLQSFPRSYKFSLDRGKFEAAKFIGNALPPELVRRQAAVVYRLLRARS